MGVYQGWPLLWLPVIIFFHLLFIEGLVLILATLNVFFRDVQHILAILLNLGFFLTPIFYSLDQVPAPFNRWILFSPLAQIISAYQDVFYYNRNPDLRVLSAFMGLSLLLSGIGMFFFERHKETFAEKV